jgi:hypothetical protein
MMKLGLLNSRMKDFYDVWLLMRKFDFNGTILTEDLKKTFNHRKTELPQERPLFAQEIYDNKSDRQMLWMAFLRKNDIKNAPDKLSAIAKTIDNFLIKHLKAIKKGKVLNETWKAARKWEIKPTAE